MKRRNFRNIPRFAAWLLGAAVLLLFALVGCGGSETEDSEKIRVLLQTDWYPQPEHGGFYQALVKGYYAEEGLDVEILSGGPNANTIERAALGRVHFSLGRSESVITAVSRGVPLVMAGAHLRKDPLAIMFHPSAGIESLADLDGRTLMANPGLTYLEVLRRAFGIDFQVIPMDYGMDRFLADSTFVQQVFVTNEPYFVRERGVEPGLLLLSDSGFEPYQVWYTSRAFLRQHPDTVDAFTRASIRGWQDFLTGDREDALALIAERNPRMTSAFMAFSVETMIDRHLVTGDSGDIAEIGQLDPERIAEQVGQLVDLGIVEEPMAVESLIHVPGSGD